MKKLNNLTLLVMVMLSVNAIAQITAPNQLNSNSIEPEWQFQSKAPGDSCGTYFNNYVGLSKTSLIRQEPLRRGNATESSNYNGRAQRFRAPQPIEIYGVEFYSYINNNPNVDSLMVITSLNEYDAVADSVGLELTRDTVFVSHTNFSVYLPNISVKSYFDTPITMTTDYIVSVFTPTDDSLIIIANDPFSNDGNGEGLSHALYDNPNYPSYYGWYSMLTDFAYDYDYLLSPLVKHKMPNMFSLQNDSICVNVNDGCVSYQQMPVFTDQQYNSNSSNSTNSIFWNWGDNTFNTGLTSACHTYQNAGNYTINLSDTLYIWDVNNTLCILNLSDTIIVLDSANADFTFSQTNTTVDFNTTTTVFDTLWWDFGDGTTASNITNPTHVYGSLGTFDVWLHIVNSCSEDSIMYQITTDDVSLTDYTFQDLKLFPNPVKDILQIELGLDHIEKIEIISTRGKTIYQNQKILDKQVLTIDMSEFSPGLYFVKFSNSNDTQIIKVVKQ
jgi:PKD repeat protein